MKTLYALALVGLVAVAPCAAGEQVVLDGNSLLHDCLLHIRSSDGAKLSARPEALWGIPACQNYVMGLLDMYLGSCAPQEMAIPLFCVSPEGVPPRQAIRVIVRYLQAHPERLHLARRELAVAALHEAFPCPPTPAPRQPK
jgi:hypothetical protein